MLLRLDAPRRRVAFVLKGYPRLSETFIAQEILALEGRGLDILIVNGPFMNNERRAGFEARAARLPNVVMTDFVPGMERLMASASGIVAMGGYNTFCEILSFDKPALIMPRTEPRLEQFIRTERAAELGLVAMISEQQGRDPQVMAAALRRLPEQAPPSNAVIPGLLDGMPNVNRLAKKWLDRGRTGRVAARARLGA